MLLLLLLLWCPGQQWPPVMTPALLRAQGAVL
jgi:hypothetical protein